MRSTQMSLKGHTYYMSPHQDVPALKVAIIAAVRSGGDIVHFHSFDDLTELELLISPGFPILFESKPPVFVKPASQEDIAYLSRNVSWDEI